jgi:hypothetical protein
MTLKLNSPYYATKCTNNISPEFYQSKKITDENNDNSSLTIPKISMAQNNKMLNTQ